MNAYGHENWIAFVLKFPHVDSVEKLSLSAFKSRYQSWRKKNNYNYSDNKATEIHTYSQTQVSMLPMTDSIVKIIAESVSMLNSTLETLCTFRNEMGKLSSLLPEYEVVMELHGVGKVFAHS